MRSKLKLNVGAYLRMQSNKRNTIIINSIGRSCSKLLHQMVIRASYQHKLGQYLNSGFVSDIDTFKIKPGQIIKTHCPVSRCKSILGKADVRIVYLYSDINTIIQSNYVQGNNNPRWFKRHLKHFHVDDQYTPSDLLTTDCLNLYSHIHDWFHASKLHKNIFFVRDDFLFDDVNGLSEFLRLSLPEQERYPRKSSAKFSPKQVDVVASTYAKLNDFVNIVDKSL